MQAAPSRLQLLPHLPAPLLLRPAPALIAPPPSPPPPPPLLTTPPHPPHACSCCLTCQLLDCGAADAPQRRDALRAPQQLPKRRHSEALLLNRLLLLGLLQLLLLGLLLWGLCSAVAGIYVSADGGDAVRCLHQLRMPQQAQQAARQLIRVKSSAGGALQRNVRCARCT
jgi:hypothetical protein